MELKKSYKQTEVGIIPNDWNVKPFVDVSSMKGRIGWQGLNKEEFNNKTSDPFLITGMNFKNGEIRWDEVYHVPEDRYEIAKDIQLKDDDVLMTKDGTIGKLLYVTKIPYPYKATLNSHLLLFRPKYKSYNSKFLYYQLSSKYFKQFIEENKSGTTFFGISQESVGKYPFILPPLKEQKAIAQVLTDTDQLIQNLKTLITKKKAIKQGAMQELLAGKKRLKGFEGEWNLKKLGEIADIKGGGTPSTNIPEFWNGNIDWFTPTEVGKSKYVGVSKRKITESGFENCSSILFPIGTILLTTRAGIGDLAILTKEACTNQGFQSFIVGKEIDNEFTYYLLKTLKDKFTSKASGSTFQEISPNNLKSIEVLIPELKEQKAIAQILSDMDLEIEALETQLQKTENLKQGMMQELLTGKIRLVAPVAQSTKKDMVAKVKAEIKTIPIPNKPKKDSKTENLRNEHITDAVLIGTMAEVFGSDKFPLTRFMYTKVSYLVKRFKEEEDNGYLKKAAGPYKPKTRYGGAEKIALGNKYVKKHISNHKGKKYENFIAGENSAKAVEYFKKWYGDNALQWIQQFKFTKRNQLELWATVDMAMQDLLLANKLVNFQTVKQLINDDKEWRPKLKRPIFSDDNLKSAIVKLNQLFR